MPRWMTRHRDERGAVAVVVGIVSTLLLLFAALAVDLGTQRVLRRDLQAMADMIAVDMARHLDGSTHAVIKARESWRGQLEDSVQRNLNENPTPDVKAQQQQETAVLTAVGAPDLLVTAVMGWIDDDLGEFVPVEWPKDNNAVPKAVKVTITNTRDFVFGGLTGHDKGGATRSAVANADGGACFSLGSYAAAVRSGDSGLLGPLLGNALGLTAVGYNGLLDVDANIPLADLALELGALTAEEFADTSVSMGQFYLAMAQVLRKQGDTVNAELLEDAASLNMGPLSPVRIGDLITLEPGAEAALESEVNVLDLVTGAAIISDGKNALTLQDLGVTIPILGSGFTSNLSLIEKPQTACGRKGTTKDTSQINLTLNGSIVNADTSTFPLLGPLLGSLANVKVSATPALSVQGASGHGVLNDIRCDPEGITVGVNGSLAKTELVVPIVITASLIGLANVKIGIIVRVTNPMNPLSRSVVLDFPPKAYDTPYAAGSGGLGLSGATTTLSPNPAVHSSKYVTTELLGLDLLGLVSALVNSLVGNISPIANAVVSPIVTALDTLVLGPLGKLAGLSVAGVDVIGHKQPTCNLPNLVG